jgi:glycosyltransferase involved in cell wall biosynthesis
VESPVDTPVTAPRRVLFVTYVFPPVGGGGVQRVTKFLKYLPSHGWIGSVLTASNPSVPVFDRTLIRDVPADTDVVRARTWEPGYAVKRVLSAGEESRVRAGGAIRALGRGVAKLLLHPDPQILWAPAAIPAGRRLLARTRHDVIVASGPPFSCFLIAAALARSGLPLVLDFRDEWDLWGQYAENRRVGRLEGRVHRAIQAHVVRAADALLATTRASARSLEEVKSRSGSRARVTCIYNGFDPDDFRSLPSRTPSDGQRYRLVYTGTLWRMTSVAPVVEALLRLATARSDLAGRFELVVAGRRTSEQDSLLSTLEGGPVRLVRHPYLEHAQVLDLVAGASRLLVLLSDVPGAERVMPAKVFEYLAARRPILAVAPRGEVWQLLEGVSHARCVAPGDISGLVSFLDTAAQEDSQAREDPVADPAAHSRIARARQLASLLDAIRSPDGGRTAVSP